MKESAEYLTSNRFIRYPFADDTVLSASDLTSRAVFGCFVDAMVHLKGYGHVPDPKVTGLSLSGHTLSFTLSGQTDVRLTCTRSRTKFPVVFGESDWCWYSFVLSSDGINELEASEDVSSIWNDELSLSARCVSREPLHVTSFDIYGGTKEKRVGDEFVRMTLQEALESDPDVSVTGPLRLSEGFNASLAAFGNELTISASPGAGSGTATCPCEAEQTSDDNRGVWSSDGHVRIFSDKCYDFMHETYETHDRLIDRGAGHVSIQAKCKACCTCDMYGTIVNGRLVPLKDAILAAKSSLDESFKKYESSVRKWNERLHTALPEDIVLTMTSIPMESAGTAIRGAGVSGRMSRCGFSATVRNDSFVDVTVVIEDITSNGRVFQQTIGYMSGDVPTVLSSAKGQSVRLQPGKSLLISYFVRSDSYGTTSSRSGFSSTVKIAAYQGDVLVTRRSKVVNA